MLNLNGTVGYHETHMIRPWVLLTFAKRLVWQNITGHTERLTSGTADQSLRPSEYAVQAFVKATLNTLYV